MPFAISQPMPYTPRDLLPRRRWLRWSLISLALGTIALGLLEWAGWPFLRAPLERALSNGLAREVRIGPELELRLIGSVRLRSDSLRIGSPAGAPVVRDDDGQARPFVDADHLHLVLPYSTVVALLRGNRDGPLVVRALEVRRLGLGLARRADGLANWQLGKAEPPGTAPSLPEFGRLVVEQGRLHLDDAQARLALDATLSTREGSADRGDEPGGLEVKATGRYRDMPVEARLRSSGLLPLAAADESSAAVPIRLELGAGKTQLAFDGQGRDLLHLAALDGQVRLAGPSLAALGTVIGATLPATGPYMLRAQLRKAGAVWHAAVAEFELGSSRLAGDFTFDPQPAVPVLSGKLAGARLQLQDLGPALGGDKGAEADAAPNRVLPGREFKVPALGAMNADVSVQLDRLALGTPKLDVLAPVSGRIVLRDRVLRIDDLVARASGGELRGSLSLDASRKLPLWQTDLRWSGVRLDRFLRPRNPAAEGATPYVSGSLGGRAKLQGSGNSTAAMLGSLGGSAEAWLRDGRVSTLLTELAGIDLAESLGVAVRGDEGLPVRCAVLKVVVKRGLVSPEVAVIDTSDSTLVVTGSVSLADEKLALEVTSRPHDMSLLSLRSPVGIDGTFAQPQINVDASRIGLRIAAAAALAAVVTPLAGLLALADLGEADREVCAQALETLKSPAAPKRAPPVKSR